MSRDRHERGPGLRDCDASPSIGPGKPPVGRRALNLWVFRDQHRVETLDHLRALLDHRHTGMYGAFWLAEEGASLPTIGMFINGGEACTFFIRHEGDPGFHSLGREPENPEDGADFLVDNYQLDRYPREMIVPTSQAVEAFEEFFRTGDRPSVIRWLEL